MSRTVLEVRRGLCLDLAEAIERRFAFRTHPRWDVDRCARLLEAHLPLSYAEAQAGWEALEAAEPAQAPRRSVLDDLREALGLGREIGLPALLRTAIARIKGGNADA